MVGKNNIKEWCSGLRSANFFIIDLHKKDMYRGISWCIPKVIQEKYIEKMGPT